MKKLFYLIICFITYSCSNETANFNENENNEVIDITMPDGTLETGGTEQENTNQQTNYNLLALGDSYTIGASVCETCRFPEQLKEALISEFDSNKTFELKVIARTGWTTTSLINAIKNGNLSNDYDLTTLLIGVNNEFQNKPFSLYEKEFPQLVNTAIVKSKGIKNRVIVISIPDYAYTPFGNGNTNISKNIDTYNLFAQNYCTANDITFVNITEITRMGLSNPRLVASDGLHPSELAYSQFVESILPFAIDKLSN
jgi:lysophospholipase L1-like esterase